jgi:transcriptional regulator with XRE-family HTH domain
MAQRRLDRRRCYLMHGSLATKLRVLRAERGLTVRQVAELSGVAKETISQIERGERHPYDRTLAKLAHAYDVPVKELLEEPVLASGASPKAEPPASGAGRTAEEFARDVAERAQRLTEEVPARMQEIAERVASGAVGEGVSSGAAGEVSQGVSGEARADKAQVLALLALALEEGTITEDEIQEMLAASEVSKRS